MLAAVALFVLLAVPGCGGGDGDNGASAGSAGNETETDTTGNSPESGGGETPAREGAGEENSDAGAFAITKAKFIKETNAICREASAEFEADLQPRVQGGLSTKKAESLVVELMIPAIEAEVREIRALGAPPGEEEEVEAILSSLQDVADEAREDPFILTVQRGAWDETERLAQKYGIETCGSL